jgi:NAD(P)-dependent dehydrogenase (short-subunit alcohol dehydrogenase family)
LGNLQSTLSPHPETNYKALLEHNAKVYLAARNENKTLPAIEKLKQVTGKDNIHFIKLDLGDLPSCAAAAKELSSKEPKLDILFLNAYHPHSSKLIVVESWSHPQIAKPLKDTNYNGYSP